MKRFIPGYFSLKNPIVSLNFSVTRSVVNVSRNLFSMRLKLIILAKLFYRSLDVKSNRVKPRTTILGRHTQTESERLVQTAQGLELNFFLETTRFLE